MKKYRLLSEKQLNELVEEKGKQYAQKLNREYAQEILNNRVDMATLQNQINPHFLYNSLECIRGQALLYEVPEIAETTQAISKFFRYSINSKSNIVTLKEEIDNIKNYMKIQQYRFKDRFSLDILYEKEDDQILEALLPKLTFQPIVENAIVHGFEEKSSDCNIKIKIEATRKHLMITISDNGRGMDEGTLEELNQKMVCPILMNEQSLGRHNGIAMDNVNKRLKLYFGEEYGVTISSVEEMGTDVEIYIPSRIQQ